MTLHPQHHQYLVNLLFTFQSPTFRVKPGLSIRTGTSNIPGWNTLSRKTLHSAFHADYFSHHLLAIVDLRKASQKLGFGIGKHATGTTGVLSKHANCKTHKLSVIAWQQYLAAEKHQSVAEQLGSNRAEQIKKNRHYIASIIEVLLLCSKQEIAFRGHDECDTSLNRGNFREILGLVAGHDSVVEEWLSHGPRNAKYTSPTIQNNILSIMATLVRRSICSAVQKTGYYSIMVDETKDLSKQEQLSIAVRYIDVDKIAVMERFLTFFPAKALNAESLTQYILDTLTLYNIDPQMIVSQGYDGASVMSGSCSGVQKRIREVAPCASYIHCHAHVLNLVLVDCAKKNQHAADFFHSYRHYM